MGSIGHKDPDCHMYVLAVIDFLQVTRKQTCMQVRLC